MQRLYDCTVRLNGEMKNEVRKTGVTAAEIAVLTAIHEGADAGVGAVHGVTPAGSANRDDEQERARLANIYAQGLANNKMTLDMVLGFRTVPLPQTINGVDSAPPPKTGRRAKVEPLKAEVTESEAPADEPISQAEFA